MKFLCKRRTRENGNFKTPQKITNKIDFLSLLVTMHPVCTQLTEFCLIFAVFQQYWGLVEGRSEALAPRTPPKHIMFGGKNPANIP